MGKNGVLYERIGFVGWIFGVIALLALGWILPDFGIYLLFLSRAEWLLLYTTIFLGIMAIGISIQISSKLKAFEKAQQRDQTYP